MTVLESQRDALTKLVHRSRRFFPPGAAQEIWADFGPVIANVQHPDAYGVRFT